jgi:hypothetical protein
MGVPRPPSVETTTLERTGALRTVRLPGAARPEIVAAGGRVYVLFLDPRTRAFMAAVYDATLGTVVTPPRALVTADQTWGHPTDIRVARDGDALVAFYEMADDRTGTASLWGVRLGLSPSLPLLSPPSAGPLAQAPFHYRARDGEELLDDPAPLVTPNAVYVATRLKDTLAPGGRAVLRVRELSRDRLAVRRTFDCDLSRVISGGLRNFSLLAPPNGDILLVAPTTVGNGFAPIDLAVPADLVRVTFNSSWRMTGSTVLVQGRGDSLISPMGLAWRGPDLLVTYRDIVHAPTPMSAAQSILAVFAPNGRERSRIVLDTTPFGGQRPRVPRTSLAVGNGLVYVGGETQLGAYLAAFDQLR